MHIQWFPGHMMKAVRMMEENAALCDVLIYVIDARAAKSCINPIFEKILQNKKVLYVLNKCDLVEKSDADKWCSVFSAQGKACVKAVGTSGDCAQIVAKIKELTREKTERFKQKGANKFIRVMVIGIPNSGKSTLINSMRKKAAAQTGDKPGVTRGKQWLQLDDYIDLLDTPGTLWGRFENQTIAKHLAYVGSISEDVLDAEELAFEFVSEIAKTYPDNLKERYSLEELPADAGAVLEQIALSRGYKLRGAEADLPRTSKAVLDDFRKGRLGKIMLEKP